MPLGADFTPAAPLQTVLLELLGELGSSGVRGQFLADIVVGSNGAVSDVRVTKSLGADVDAVLVAAARKLTFSPATLDGAPVAVLFPLRLDFTSK